MEPTFPVSGLLMHTKWNIIYIFWIEERKKTEKPYQPTKIQVSKVLNRFEICEFDILFSKLGCWLGDSASGAAEGKKIWIPGGIQDRVRTAESLSNRPSKLAINLMNALFTTDQLAEGNCTPSSFHTLLDQTIIQGICCKYIYSYARHSLTLYTAFSSAQFTLSTFFHATRLKSLNGGRRYYKLTWTQNAGTTEWRAR